MLKLKTKISGKKQNTIILCLCFIIFLSLFYIIAYKLTTVKEDNDNRIFYHSGYDTYTLQALAWRNGECKLDKNYEWLELAVYNDEYYVSFPVTPTIPMFILTFIFGEYTPSNLAVVIYMMIAFIFAFLCCRKKDLSLMMSIILTLFVTLGSAAMFLSMEGGVWFQAQLLSLALTLGAFYFIMSERKHKYLSWNIAMVLLALAVGCRPFQILYFPLFIYMICNRISNPLKKIWKFMIAPGVIASLYMWYNYIRFGNILDFGRKYLPEFSRNNTQEFSLNYIIKNQNNIFANFPKFSFSTGLTYDEHGFCFYLSNTIFILFAFALTIYIFKTLKTDKNTINYERTETLNLNYSFILIITIFIHITLLWMHSTVGAWQFGSRYTVDVIPGVLIFLLLSKPKFIQKPTLPVVMLCSFAIAFNVFGAIDIYRNYYSILP